jgi:creatinine amidohydrolase/Fe(II)-dependent formamide hydrolase-like protein
MRSSAFGDAAKDWIAVRPPAATERHGPHLPLGVDGIIAEGMIAECIRTLPDAVPVTCLRVSFLPVWQVCAAMADKGRRDIVCVGAGFCTLIDDVLKLAQQREVTR